MPYAANLWHWFGRGQFVLLVLNEEIRRQATEVPRRDPWLDWRMGDEWMRVAW